MDIIQQLENLQDLGDAVTHVEDVILKHHEECKSESPDDCDYHTRCLTVAVVMSRLGLSLEDIGFVGGQLVCLEELMDIIHDESEDSDVLDAQEIN